MAAVEEEEGDDVREVRRDVLRGRTASLPPLRTNLIRVYLASTPTDMSVERSYFVKHVVPRLREYCRLTYNLEFQLVDLRQGSEVEDPAFLAVRLHELDLCQRLSMGPTALVLVGQRYGPYLLPASIAAAEFEAIRACVENPQQVALLDTCYSRDDNAVPPEYTLTNGWSTGGDRSHVTGTESGQAESGRTESVRAELSRALREGARRAVQMGRMDSELENKFFMSEIDLEVERAIMADPNANSRCLFFQRLIANINFSHEKSRHFLDINDNRQVDADAKYNFQQMTEEKIQSKLHSSNIHKFSVWWSDDGGINESTHAQYLEDLAEAVNESIRRQIDAAMTRHKRADDMGLYDAAMTRDGRTDDMGLYDEVVQHAHSCVWRSSRVFGRDPALQTVRQYLLGGVRQPLILHGIGGVGKSTVMAKTASLVSLWLEDEPSQVSVVLRFLGDTPTCSSLDSTIRSVCFQISAVLNTPSETLPLDLPELISHFLQLLSNIPTDHTLILLLDGLDQLDRDVMTDGVHDVQWIPRRLPENVKLVLSTRDYDLQGAAILEDLTKNNISKRQFVPLTPLDYETCKNLLRRWLKTSRRTLTSQQWDVIDEAISNGCLPLYLKLTLRQVVTWTSATVPGTLPPDLDTSTAQIIDTLETKHSRRLVRTAVGILLLSNYGVSEAEMEDMLSLDEGALDAVFESSIPAVRRFPTAVWSRLSYDLRDYITRRTIDGATVINWSHSVFANHCQRKYLSNWVTPTGHRAKNLLLDYLTGRWADDGKPYTLTKDQQLRLSPGTTTDIRALRYVPPQPTLSSRMTPGGSRRWRVNQRKVRILSTILWQDATYWDNEEALFRFMRYAPFNLEMLVGMLLMGEWCHLRTILAVRQTIDDENGEFEKRQISIFSRSLEFVREELVNNPSAAIPYVVGQLLGNFNFLTHPSAFIRQADSLTGRQLCALVSTHQQLALAGGVEYLDTGRHVGPVRDCCYVGNTLFSISERLIGVAFDSSGRSTVVVNVKITGVPDEDYIQTIQHFTLSTQSKNSVQLGGEDLWITAQLLLSLRHQPKIFFVSAFDGHVLRIVDCTKDVKDLTSHMIRSVKIVGASSLGTLLHVSFVDAATIRMYSCDTGKCVQSRDTSDVVVDVTVMTDETHCMLLANGDIVPLDSAEDLESRVLSTVKPENKLSCWNQGKWGSRSDDTIVLGLSSGGVTVIFGVNPLSAKKVPPISTTVYLPDMAIPHHIDCDIKGVRIRYAFVLVCSDNHVHLVKFEVDSNKKCTATILTTVRRRYQRAFLFDQVVVACHNNVVHLGAIAVEGTGSYTIRPVLTIDAHYTPIVQLYPSHISVVPDRVLTAIAEDGSCRAFNIAPLLTSHCHLCQFDRLGAPVTTIEAGCSLAITLEAHHDVASVWDIATGTILKELHHPSPVSKVCLDRTERYVATIDSTSSLLVWDILTLASEIHSSQAVLTYRLEGTYHWVFPAKNSFFIASDSGQYVSVDLRSRQIVAFHPHHLPCPLLAVIPDPRGHVMTLGSVKSVVAVTDPKSGEEISRLDLNAKSGLSLTKYGTSIRDVCAWGANTLLLIGDVLLCVCHASSSMVPVYRGVTDKAAVKASGPTVLLADGGTLSSLSDVNGTWRHYQFILRDSLFKLSPDGRYVVCVAQPQTLKLIRVEDGVILASFAFLVRVTSLAMTFDGVFAVIGGSDGRLYSYVIADPDERSHDERISGLPSRQQPFVLQIERPHDPRFKALRNLTAGLETNSFAGSEDEEDSGDTSEEISQGSTSYDDDYDDGDNDEDDVGDDDDLDDGDDASDPDSDTDLDHSTRDDESAVDMVRGSSGALDTGEGEAATVPDVALKPRQDFLSLPPGAVCLTPMYYRPPTLQAGHRDRLHKLNAQFTDNSLTKSGQDSEPRDMWTAPVCRDGRQASSRLRDLHWRQATSPADPAGGQGGQATSRACTIS